MQNTAIRRYRQHGNVYNPKLDLAGCVLYAPLWRPDLAGATFYSRDSSPKLLTVTGATWGYQGRTFNGTSDKITLPNHAALNFGTDSFSVQCWVSTSDSSCGFVDKMALISGEYYGWIVGISAKLVFSLGRGSVAPGVITEYDSGITAPAGFHCYGFNIDRVNNQVKFYLDGALVATVSIAASVTVTNTQVVTIGNATPYARWLAGTIGEVLVHNRVFSAGEMMRNCQLTKWRYQ